MRTPNLNRYALRTYDEIARDLGISKGRVQQIERRALTKLRRGLARLGVKSFDR